MAFLNSFDEKTKSKIENYLSKNHILKKHVLKLSDEESYSIKSIIAIGQQERVFADLEDNENAFDLIKKMARTLVGIEKFYEPIGGIIGYHKKFLELLKTIDKPKRTEDFLKPFYVDISKKEKVEKYIQEGIRALPLMGEIYPLGGAGDRLDLINEKTKEPLPVARLQFLGKSLLELLLLDLEARENLYFKEYKKKIVTPVAIMTSDVKHNHEQILEIMEENKFFGRPKDSFCFFKQISVPVINEEGNWIMKGQLELYLKPGGHGMLWKQMVESGVFDWFYEKKREKAIIRQINNPLAGLDYNLLGFTGIGVSQDKTFGFFATEKKPNASEGIIVLKEKKLAHGFEYSNSNIEYTDFKKWDLESADQSLLSLSNTNTLFVDLKKIQKELSKDFFPGMTINLKNKIWENGRELREGRLELMMQNIADNVTSFSNDKITEEEKQKLPTFIVFNKRKKTISVTKNFYEEAKGIATTPLGAYFDLMDNYFDLLKNCYFKLPEKFSEEKFLKEGPSFAIYINPLLGPLFSDMAKKIKGGEVKLFSELRLDIGDADIENLYLEGSLVVTSVDLKNAGACILKNVKVINQGIDRSAKNIFWKNEINRKESLRVILQEGSVFEATDVVFKEDLLIEVEKNSKVRAYMEKGEVRFEKIDL